MNKSKTRKESKQNINVISAVHLNISNSKQLILMSKKICHQINMTQLFHLLKYGFVVSLIKIIKIIRNLIDDSHRLRSYFPLLETLSV